MKKMKRVMIDGLREICYMKLMPTCGLSAYKEVYTKTIIKAETHDEAMKTFKEQLADEKVMDIITSAPVYIYVNENEVEHYSSLLHRKDICLATPNN